MRSNKYTAQFLIWFYIPDLFENISDLHKSLNYRTKTYMTNELLLLIFPIVQCFIQTRLVPLYIFAT